MWDPVCDTENGGGGDVVWLLDTCLKEWYIFKAFKLLSTRTVDVLIEFER